MVQVRSLEMVEVTNGEHITVRSESALDGAEFATSPLRLQPGARIDKTFTYRFLEISNDPLH